MFLAVMMVLTMMPSGMWGSTETAWADTSGMSEIRTAEEFAAMETGGNYKLTADITVTAPYPSEFTGTFDGDGHTVTLDGTTNGVFVSTAASAVIQNLGVKGTVSGGEKIAGVVGMNAGTIENCKNAADITSDDRYVGGIAGKTTGIIQNCYNVGTIASTRTKSGVYLGGITGNIDGSSAEAKNCYNAGNISVVSTSNVAAIAGWINGGGNAENCFYLQAGNLTGTNEYVSGEDSRDRATAKTSDEMKSPEFAVLLGSAFMSKAGDYPALTWETPTASVNFNITPANAVLSINGATYTGSCNVALPEGTHSYTVSLEGYETKGGTIAVTKSGDNLEAESSTVSVSLEKDSTLWTDVRFAVTPNTATFELKDGETTVESSAEPKFTYSVLKNHTYSYTATADGYEDESGTYNFETDGPNKTVELKQVTEISVSGYKTVYTQGEQFDRAGLVVTATLSDKTQKEVTEKCTITGFDSSMPIDSQTITVSYKGKTATFGIKIEEKLFPSHVFDGLKGKATVEYSHNNSYKGKDGEEFVDDATENALKSNSAEVNALQVTVAIKFAENLKKSKFRFWYKVSSETKYDYLKINEETGKSISGEIDWTEKGLTVTGGETVTLSYVKDSSGKSGSDCIWLKDFTLEQLYGLTISVKDEAGKAVSGATIVLTDANKNSISGENGVYSLTAGTYAYTVSAFGYKSESGSFP